MKVKIELNSKKYIKKNMDEIYKRIDTNLILKKKIGELLSILNSYIQVIENKEIPIYYIYRLYQPFINRYSENLGELLNDPMYQHTYNISDNLTHEINVYENFVDGIKSFLRWKITMRKSKVFEDENVLEIITMMNESIFNNNDYNNYDNIKWPKIGENSYNTEEKLLQILEDMITETPNTDELIKKLCDKLPKGKYWSWKTMLYTVDNMIYFRSNLCQGEKKTSIITLLSAIKILSKGNSFVMSYIDNLIDDFSDYTLGIEESQLLDQIWHGKTVNN